MNDFHTVELNKAHKKYIVALINPVLISVNKGKDSSVNFERETSLIIGRAKVRSEYQRFLLMIHITYYNTHVSYCFRGFWSRFFSIFPSSFCRTLLFN